MHTSRNTERNFDSERKIGRNWNRIGIPGGSLATSDHYLKMFSKMGFPTKVYSAPPTFGTWNTHSIMCRILIILSGVSNRSSLYKSYNEEKKSKSFIETQE